MARHACRACGALTTIAGSEGRRASQRGRGSAKAWHWGPTREAPQPLKCTKRLSYKYRYTVPITPAHPLPHQQRIAVLLLELAAIGRGAHVRQDLGDALQHRHVNRREQRLLGLRYRAAYSGCGPVVSECGTSGVGWLLGWTNRVFVC
jgi:hypothetical protein